MTEKVRLFTMNYISEKIAYEKLIEDQAMTDHLTSLPNRRMLEKGFPIILNNAENTNSYGYVIFLDLGNFKNVNDGLGHHFGDALLKEMGYFLTSIQNIGTQGYYFGKPVCSSEFEKLLYSHKKIKQEV